MTTSGSHELRFSGEEETAVDGRAARGNGIFEGLGGGFKSAAHGRDRLRFGQTDANAPLPG
jgi:hypothetical protein